MNNLDIYSKYAAVPQNAQKNFNNGRFSGTDINPMWRIKALTEAFGPAGVGWYTEPIRSWLEPGADGEITAHMEINLYVKLNGEWSKPIFGTGGNTFVASTKKGLTTSDECYKMAYTDALSVACKALGFGADIYWASGRTKYTASTQAQEKKAAPATQEPPKPVPDTLMVDPEYTAKFVEFRNAFCKTNGISGQQYKDLITDLYGQKKIGSGNSDNWTKAECDTVRAALQRHVIDQASGLKGLA